jgi:hypothetical protein
MFKLPLVFDFTEPSDFSFFVQGQAIENVQFSDDETVSIFCGIRQKILVAEDQEHRKSLFYQLISMISSDISLSFQIENDCSYMHDSILFFDDLNFIYHFIEIFSLIIRLRKDLITSLFDCGIFVSLIDVLKHPIKFSTFFSLLTFIRWLFLRNNHLQRN